MMRSRTGARKIARRTRAAVTDPRGPIAGPRGPRSGHCRGVWLGVSLPLALFTSLRSM
jgi:hypothetical protein